MGRLLSVEGLGVAIGQRELISNATFYLEPGECLGLVGETGSGKSVTCRALIGMLGRIGARATHGSVLLDSVDLVPLGERTWSRVRGRQIGYVPQSSLSGLDPVQTVGRQLVETLRRLTGSDDCRSEALALLDRVQMPRSKEVFGAYAHQLSGGMRQRVMIALGTAGQPGLLVADEPTTALDVTIQREILDLLAELRRDTQMAVVLVTHDLAVVSSVSDRVAIMYSGNTVEFGPTVDVLSTPSHPYTSALLKSRPSLSAGGRRLYAIPGAPPDPENWPPGCRFAPRCPLAIPECSASPPGTEVVDSNHTVCCIRADEAVKLNAKMDVN